MFTKAYIVSMFQNNITPNNNKKVGIKKKEMTKVISLNEF